MKKKLKNVWSIHGVTCYGVFDSVAQPAIVRPRGKTVTFRVLKNALHMNRATDQLFCWMLKSSSKGEWLMKQVQSPVVDSLEKILKILRCFNCDIGPK